MKCINKFCEGIPVEVHKEIVKLFGVYRYMVSYRCPQCLAEWKEADAIMSRDDFKAQEKEKENQKQGIINKIINYAHK